MAITYFLSSLPLYSCSVQLILSEALISCDYTILVVFAKEQSHNLWYRRRSIFASQHLSQVSCTRQTEYTTMILTTETYFLHSYMPPGIFRKLMKGHRTSASWDLVSLQSWTNASTGLEQQQ
jgi:hypothetical protein